MSKWITGQGRNENAALRLFCLPYAGGATDIFRPWSNLLPSNIEVCPIQLPGRGGRLLEPPFTNLSLLVEALTSELRPYLDRPFALFGHSMGAIIVFELARQLRSKQINEPLHLFVSGWRAPQIPRREQPSFDLPEAEFLNKLRGLGGSPDGLLDNPKFIQLLLPLLRADFKMIQTYTYSPQPPLACSITALGGLQDHVAKQEDLEAWREQTTGAFSLRLLPGNHFFIHEAQPVLLALLADEIGVIVNQLAQESRA
jgi:medium-chain acyl-[acyl-carrier-protein] hydrolase